MCRFLYAAFVLTLAVLSAGTARGDDGASLLAKNKTFAGWTFGDASMSGLLLTGKAGDRQITDLRRGAIWRQTIADPKTHIAYDVGFTGKFFWYADLNGFTIPLLSDAIKYQVAYRFVMNQGLPLLDGVLRGTARVNGAATQIVRVKPRDADAIDAYIEPSSGRLVRAVIDPDGTPTTIDILDYANLEGKKIISSWHIDGPNVVMTSVDHATIIDDDFRPPAQRSKWAFGSPQPIPIGFSKTRISLRAAINGVEGDFILDTAAGSIFLNPDFARRARVKEIGRAVPLGRSGATKGSVGKIDSLAIGDNVLHDVLVRTSLDGPGPLQDFDGLLGFDFLAGAIVDIDVNKQEMTIYDPAHYAVTAPGPPVFVDLSSGQPVVPIVLDAHVKGHFLFDTGEPTALVATAKLYGPPRGVELRSQTSERSTVAGAPQVNCGSVESIDIGGAFKYTNVPACFGNYGDLFSDDGGVIGIDFLRHFNLTFDYPDSKVYLTPVAR